MVVVPPICFPLLLRIPAWATEATLQMAGGGTVQPQAGTFHRIDHEWQDTTKAVLTLPISPALSHRYNGAIAIERGPLVYALKIREDWRRIHQDRPHRELLHADWEVHPTTDWNYALEVNEATLADDVRFREHPMGDCPFSPEGAPVSVKVKGRRVPQWQMENDSAADVPQSWITSSEPQEELILIPCGCTNLRVTEFSVLER